MLIVSVHRPRRRASSDSGFNQIPDPADSCSHPTLNELCTNATKYGALSNAMGRIDITSTVDEKAQRFKLTWTEKGGPAVQSFRKCVF